MSITKGSIARLISIREPFSARSLNQETDARIRIQRKTRLHRCKAGFDCSWILSRVDSINLGPSILRQLGLYLPYYQSRILLVFLRGLLT